MHQQSGPPERGAERRRGRTLVENRGAGHSRPAPSSHRRPPDELDAANQASEVRAPGQVGDDGRGEMANGAQSVSDHDRCAGAMRALELLSHTSVWKGSGEASEAIRGITGCQEHHEVVIRPMFQRRRRSPHFRPGRSDDDPAMPAQCGIELVSPPVRVTAFYRRNTVMTSARRQPPIEEHLHVRLLTEPFAEVLVQPPLCAPDDHENGGCAGGHGAHVN